ncbi:MAG TPA: transporter [Pyrinomonadaceae bacterium]|nr:transporter [Pyrinomonadaceae bacterium]
MGVIQPGVRDTRFGFQVLALKDNDRHPALAFAYYVKIPTASDDGLGTGHTDYRVLLLVSKKLGKFDVDLNAAYLNVGREFGEGPASGGRAAVSVSREFTNKLLMIEEVAGQSEDHVQPRRVFALGALGYKVNRRLTFDVGARFGLNADAPRIGIFAGFTVGIGKPFKD